MGFDVGDEARAKRLLEELGVSPAQRTVRVRLASPASQRRFGRALSILALVVLAAFGLTNTLLLAVEGVLALLRDGPVGIAMLLVALPLLMLVLAGMSLAAQVLARGRSPSSAPTGSTCGASCARRFVPLANVASVEFRRAARAAPRSSTAAPSGSRRRRRRRASSSRRVCGRRSARRGAASPRPKLALLDRAGRDDGCLARAARRALERVGLPRRAPRRERPLRRARGREVPARTPRRRRLHARVARRRGRAHAPPRRRRRVRQLESLRISLERAAEGEIEAEEEDARARHPAPHER